MACFTVPAAEAAITGIASKILKLKEGKYADKTKTSSFKKPLSQKIGYLSKFLWCGSLLSCAEHIYHGEITLSFPFLTALKSPEETAVMLHEIATEGVFMAIFMTVMWAVFMLLFSIYEKSRIKNTLKSK